MTTQNTIERELLAFFTRHADVPPEFDVDTDLLTTIEIDSLLVMDLLLHIETNFQVSLAAREVTPANLRTVRRLAVLVAAKQQRQRQAA